MLNNLLFICIFVVVVVVDAVVAPMDFQLLVVVGQNLKILSITYFTKRIVFHVYQFRSTSITRKLFSLLASAIRLALFSIFIDFLLAE